MESNTAPGATSTRPPEPAGQPDWVTSGGSSGPSPQRPWWRRRSGIVAIIVVVFVALGAIGSLTKSEPSVASASPSPTTLAAGSTESQTVVPSTAPSLDATSAPSAAPTPPATVTAKPLATPPIVTLSDPIGDMVDANGDPAKGPKYQDIVGSIVKTDDQGNLIVSIQTAGASPSRSETKEQILFGFFLETTGDESPDYQILLQNDVGGTWNASVSEVSTGQTLDGDRFPGSATVIGDLASVRLELFAVGSPVRVKVATFTESIVYPDLSNALADVQRDDRAPDKQFPDGTDWLVFELPN